MSELISEAEIATQELAGEPAQSATAGPAALAVSAGDFAALEERIHRAVELVRREREARTQAEARAEQAEAQLQAQKLGANQLDNELRALRSERDHVRQRVENLLKQLDTLEL